MTSENTAPEIRISDWTRATGTQPGARGVRNVVLVSEHSDEHMLEAGLAAEDCDVVFVASLANAYSQVKRIAPSLVVVYLDVDEPGGFHVLSMLKLDTATSDIPVLTYITTYEPRRVEADSAPVSSYVWNQLSASFN